MPKCGIVTISMKKLIKPAFFIALAVVFGSFNSRADAASLPPGNPFYFFQDGVRYVRRAFTFNPVAKALLELRLMDERQADIVRVLSLDADESVVAIAVQAYGYELGILAEQAKGLDDAAVLDGVAKIFILHTAFFDDVLDTVSIIRYADARARIAAIKKDIIRFTDGIFEKADNGNFRARVSAIMGREKNQFKEFRAAEALIVLQPYAVSADFLKEIEKTKDDVLMAFIGAFEKGIVSLDAISRLSGDARTQFEVFDAARGRGSNLETRNALTFARGRAFNQAESNRASTATAVREVIDYTKNISATFSIVNDQSVYSLEQAEKFFADTAYGIAFQHAVTAREAAWGAFMEKTMTKDDVRQDILFLKKKYDATRAKSTALEKKILGIADMIGRAPARDIIAALRDIKLALALLSIGVSPQ